MHKIPDFGIKLVMLMQHYKNNNKLKILEVVEFLLKLDAFDIALFSKTIRQNDILFFMIISYSYLWKRGWGWRCHEKCNEKCDENV